MKILVTPTSLQPGKNEKILKPLREFADELVFNPLGRPLEEEELIKALEGCDGYIAGLDSITARVLEASPQLKAISRYGAGYDRVDIETAKNKQVIVTNTPGVNAEAVGELTFALLLSIARNIPHLNHKLKGGEWVRGNGIELKGKTLGIIGLGAIGKVVARCGQGFCMKLMAYDPFINEEYCACNQIKVSTFEEVIEQADVISLHMPLTAVTRHLLNKEVFDKMKDEAIIINASRGGLINEDDAYEALKSGKLKGLGLDAFEVEPPGDSKLFEFPTVIATPRTGAHTREAIENMAKAAIQNLIDVLTGKENPNIVSR